LFNFAAAKYAANTENEIETEIGYSIMMYIDFSNKKERPKPLST